MRGDVGLAVEHPRDRGDGQPGLGRHVPHRGPWPGPPSHRSHPPSPIVVAQHRWPRPVGHRPLAPSTEASTSDVVLLWTSGSLVIRLHRRDGVRRRSRPTIPIGGSMRHRPIAFAATALALAAGALVGLASPGECGDRRPLGVRLRQRPDRAPVDHARPQQAGRAPGRPARSPRAARSRPGRFLVRFPAIGLGSRGNVHVTPVNRTGHYCEIVRWFRAGPMRSSTCSATSRVGCPRTAGSRCCGR